MLSRLNNVRRRSRCQQKKDFQFALKISIAEGICAQFCSRKGTKKKGLRPSSAADRGDWPRPFGIRSEYRHPKCYLIPIFLPYVQAAKRFGGYCLPTLFSNAKVRLISVLHKIFCTKCVLFPSTFCTRSGFVNPAFRFPHFPSRLSLHRWQRWLASWPGRAVGRVSIPAASCFANTAPRW